MVEKVRTTSRACGSASLDELKKIWAGYANAGLCIWN
jgi:hypothetical protein